MPPNDIPAEEAAPHTVFHIGLGVESKPRPARMSRITIVALLATPEAARPTIPHPTNDVVPLRRV